jgi:flavin-dependent dehydrogenase
MDVKLRRTFTSSSRDALDNFVGIKHHLRVPFPDDLIALHNFEGGYCGVVRVEDGRTCACYLTTAAVLKSHGGDIAAVEQHVLRRNPALNRIFSSAENLYAAPLAISQISFQQKEAVLDGVLMVGDTAGLITPLCGNGMSMAFRSAKLAYQCCSHFLEGNVSRERMEEMYRSEWKRLFSRRLMAGRAVQSRFGSSGTTTAFLRLMKALPFLQSPLVRATHGRAFD